MKAAAPEIGTDLLASAPGVARNRALLAQCTALLARLDASAFTRALPDEPTNTIGRQLRHVLDHVEALLDGAATRSVDYDARCRDTPCEVDLRLAGLRIDALDARLAALSASALGATVRVYRDDGDSVASSVERELDFLASHTTHHLAIIALLCRMHRLESPQALGVAASTLRHRSG